MKTVDLQKHRPRRSFVVVLEVFAALIWLGAFMLLVQVPGALGIAAAGGAVVSGLIIAAFAAILDGISETRYLTALIATRLSEEDAKP